MEKVAYDRQAAAAYAKKWAHARNPSYYNFDTLGGDCTNFASQCLLAGGAVMNYTKDVGWYYSSLRNRAAAWSDAQYFHNFLVNNKRVGPVGEKVPLVQLETGDFILLKNTAEYYHTLVVAGFSHEEPLVCAHTEDAFMRQLRAYHAVVKQGIHIVEINR